MLICKADMKAFKGECWKLQDKDWKNILKMLKNQTVGCVVGAVRNSFQCPENLKCLYSQLASIGGGRSRGVFTSMFYFLKCTALQQVHNVQFILYNVRSTSQQRC